MKPASSALQGILAGPQFYMADCYSFTLVDGTVARYTTADQDLTDQATGHVFSSRGPFFERSKVKFQVGVQVDELDIVLTAGPNDVIDGVPWLSALRGGVLDGAEIQLDRAFMANFGDTSAGLLTIFAGRIAEVDAGRTQATIKANTHLELLTLQMPWRLFQPGCAFTLYDNRCTLNKTSFGVAAVVGAGSTEFVANTSLDQAAGWASLGTVTFTSGVLANKSFTLREHDTGGILKPVVPFAVPPASGDTCMVYPGCDKQQATCRTKFSNLAHFGGFPYVPAPETAV